MTDELQQIIKQLSPHKAPGTDSITNKSTRPLPENTVQKLLSIIYY